MKSFFRTCAVTCGTTLTTIGLAMAGEPVNAVSEGPAAEHHCFRASDHAPIGVMADHTHDAGELMLSYRYMFMPMRQNYMGSNSVSDASVLRDYMVVPTKMDMHMHMLGAMYAPTDRITLAFMAPYTYMSMDHLRRDGKRFSTDSDGWGDLSLTSMFSVLDSEAAKMHLSLGVGFPTGSITEKDSIPGPGLTQLPYAMQPGSGSWSIKPGLTYTGRADRFTWGAQVLGNIYLDDNSQGYRLGDSVDATAWVAYDLSDQLSTSLRILGSYWDDISGSAKGLMIPAGAVQTANPDLSGGGQIDIGIGLNYLFGGALSGNRIGVEALLPIYRDLDGPQLGSEWMLVAGWQFVF